MNLISKPPSVPLLENGEQLTQVEFHRRYAVCTDDFKAELIGGIVHMPSPLRRPHAAHHAELSGALWLYKAATPGLEVLDNATTILGGSSEPQPDLALRILPEFGGRSGETAEEYVKGPPELLAEIAHSRRAVDLHGKKVDYRNAGVIEYVALCIEERKLYWFRFPSCAALKADGHGIYRSRVFPGLWIDGPALLARDSARVMAVIQQGIAHPSHAAFVKRLEAARGRKIAKDK